MNNALPVIISSDLNKIVESFMRSPYADNIKKIILFGSFVDGKYQPDSDIDIAVVVKDKPPKYQLADYYLIADNIQRETDLLFCTEEQLLSGKYVFSEILNKGVTII